MHILRTTLTFRRRLVPCSFHNCLPHHHWPRFRRADHGRPARGLLPAIGLFFGWLRSQSIRAGQLIHTFSISRCAHMNGFRIATVRHDLVRLKRHIQSRAMTRPYNNDHERPVFAHSRKLAAMRSNCQCLGRIVPRNRNRGIQALLVVVIVVFVLIKNKRSVRAGVHS